MPIYEYQCQACQQHLEKLQKISDEPLRECPACHEPALKKLVSASVFRLKGGGWYETDFKTGNKKNLSSDSASDAGSGSSGDSGSGSSGDSGSGSSGAADSDKSAGSSAKATDKKEVKPAGSQKTSSSSPAVKDSK